MNSTQFVARRTAALLALAMAGAFAAPTPTRANPSDGDVFAAFQVTDGQLFDLPPAAASPQPFTTFVPLDEATRQLSLAPHSVRAPSYRVIVAAGDGTYTDVPPGPETTWRGRIVSDEQSAVAASLLPQGLFARIILGDGREFWVEPVASKLASAGPGLHLVYRAEDSYAETGLCATAAAHSAMRGGPTCVEPACLTGLCLAEVALDTDVEFNVRYGAGTEDRANLVINTVNIQFERDVDIRFLVTALILRPAEPDPYNSTTLTPVLGELKTEWQTHHTDIPRDIVHLLAGRELIGGIGGSYNSTVCASIFTGQGYSVVETDYNNSWPHTTDVSAHEFGHTFGATHCPCHVAGDPSTDYTMNAGITGANRFHPIYSIPEIVTFRDSVACLDPLLPPQDTTTTLPFIDSFTSQTINQSRWTAVIGPEVNGFALNEPTGPYSLNLNGNSLGGDEIRSAVIDLTGIEVGSLVLEYDWQQKGGGNNPEDGENLWVEWFDTDGRWTRLAFHPRVASPSSSFAHAVNDSLAEDQYHAGFRLGFFIDTSLDGCEDDWFIDNVHLYSTSATESCSDSVQNQGEDRIDCGGPCAPCQCLSDGACGDGDMCNGTEFCNASGQCTGGSPPTCDDGDACTTDSCAAASGCTFTPDACGGACCAAGSCAIVDSPAACQSFVCNAADHLPVTFTGCYGDVNGDSFVTPSDRGFVAANIGSTNPAHLCVYDMDGNGFINPGDRGFIAVNIGLCSPLPDWQNGNGTNHGAPDTRFGTATFQGAGTSCASVTCP